MSTSTRSMTGSRPAISRNTESPGRCSPRTQGQQSTWVAVHRWLSEGSYWARGRDRAVQDAAIDASMNFGVFEPETGRQVGYARVVTDAVTFAWVCDVFVDPAVRGRGIGVTLMARVCEKLDSLGLARVALATDDAHGLYHKFGFEPLSDPGKWMSRKPPAA